MKSVILFATFVACFVAYFIAMRHAYSYNAHQNIYQTISHYIMKGTGVALVTPFTEDYAIDYKALERLLQHTADADFWVINGTTAEAPTLSLQEKRSVLAFVKGHNPEQKPLVYGMGGNDTAEIARRLGEVDLTGVSAILSGSPHYSRPTQAGIVAHYRILADASPIPLILYNVPSRTASNLTAETTIELSHHPNIMGIKEANTDMVQCMNILKHAKKGFQVFSGDDFSAIALIALGAHGVISVIANAFPKTYGRAIELALQGDMVGARQTYFSLLKINELLFKEGNPAGVKKALQLLEICRAEVRLPLLEASKSLTLDLEQELEHFA